MINWKNSTQFCFGVWLANLCFASCATADSDSGFDNAWSALTLDVGVIESTHLGAFESYIIPEESSGGGSGATDAFDILFPNGLIPRNAAWRFAPRPGMHISLSLEHHLFPSLVSSPSRFSVFFVQDSNQLKIHAPKGVGIFIDPTDLDLRTEFIGAGLELSVPVLEFATPQAAHSVLVGAGAMVYQSTSSASAKSDFLDIHITHEDVQLAPLASLEYRFRKEDTNSKLLPDSYAIKISAFKTENFFTAFTSATFSYDF